MGTRNRSRGAGLLFLALLAPACATAPGLSRRLPSGTPPAETLAGWERAGGEAEDGERVVVSALFVNPLRPGLYDVTRFRVDTLARRPALRTRRVKEPQT